MCSFSFKNNCRKEPNMSISYKSKKIYSLRDPVWLKEVGMKKGYGHDRQHLGIILGADQVLELKQLTGDEKLILRLLNDDSVNEGTYQLDTDWKKISIPNASVPFIDTPHGTGSMWIEYRYPTESKLLPVYEKNENEPSFFNFWGSTNADFALLSSLHFVMLIPGSEKEDIGHGKPALDFNEIIASYDKIFNYYDGLAGLSFDADRQTDMNIFDKYFFKVDFTARGTYYCDSWAVTADIDNWLNNRDTNWTRLHAISIGYFKTSCYTKDLCVSAYGNMYAALYQNTFLPPSDTFLFRRIGKVTGKVRQHIISNRPLYEWDIREKLLLFVLMSNAAGNTFTHFNRKLRQLFSEQRFIPNDHHLLDLFSKYCAKFGQVDITPLINRVSGKVSTHQALKNKFYQVPVGYPLEQLVCVTSLSMAENQLKLQSSLSLVTPTQVAATGLTGNVTINLDIADFKQIYGEEMSLMEGTRLIYQIKIREKLLVLKQLPIGVYTLFLPTGRSIKYDIDQNYLIVKGYDGVVNIKYKPKPKYSPSMDGYRFEGLVDPIKGLQSRIDTAAKKMRKRQNWMCQKHMPFKDDIFMLVSSLGAETQLKNFARYADVLPADNDEPGPWVGSKFEISFAEADKDVYAITIDFVKLSIGFHVKDVPYESTTVVRYASIEYRNAHGFVQFKYNFLANLHNNERLKELVFSYSGGEELFLHHMGGKESKLTIFNEMQQCSIRLRKNFNVLRFCDSGLSCKASEDDCFGRP